MRKIALIGGVFITLWIYGCSYFVGDFKTPKVFVIGIQPVSLGLFEQRFKLKLRIQNPNDSSLQIKGMRYFLNLEGHAFAHGISNEEITIPEMGEQIITVPVSSNLSVLLSLLRQLDHEKIDYEIKGDIRLANRLAKLPFSYKNKVDLKF